MQTVYTEKRKAGFSLVGELPWGTHFCQFYETERDLFDILIPYFKAGLENNELCLWVVFPPLTLGAVSNELRNAVPRLEEYVQKGQLEIVREDQWTANRGDSHEPLLSALDDAMSKGFDGLRIAGCPVGNGKGFTCHGSEMIGSYNIIAVYPYPRGSFDAIGLMETVKNHHFALVRNAGQWEVLESSEARTVKDALKRTEEKLESLFTHMMEGFAYHRMILDKTGKPCDYVFLEVNEAFEKMTGLSAPEIIGKRVTEVIPGIEHDPADWIGRYGQVAMTGEPVSFESYAEPMRKWYSVSAFSPHKGFFGVMCSEITERKLMEKDLRRQANMIGLSHEAMFAWDMDGPITSWNLGAARLYGFSEQEAVGVSPRALLRTIFPVSVENTLGMLKKEGAYAGELIHTTKGGGAIAVESRMQLMTDVSGRQIVVEINRDVTERKRNEQALRESEALYRTTIASIGDAVITTDEHGRVTYLNRVAEDLTGWTKEDAAGQSLEKIFTIFNELTRKPAENPVGRVLREGQIVGLANHTCLISRQGEEIPVEDSAAPIKNAEGKVIGAVMVFHDVTEKRKAEKALKKSRDELEERVRERTEELRSSELHYTSLFNAIDEGFCIVEVIFDENEKPVDYRFLEINESFERQTGLVNARGKRMRELAPKHEEHWFEIYGRVAATGEPARFQNRAEQLHRWYDVYAFRFGQPENRHVGIVFNDITERKAAEDLLQRAGAYNRSLIEASLDPLVTIDREGRISDVNAATELVTGYSRQELIGTDFSDYFTDSRKAKAGYLMVFNEGFVRDYPLEIHHREGRITPVLYNASVYRDDAGDVIGVFAAARDVSEQQKLEAQLRQAQKMEALGTLTGGIAHDFNNILAAVIGFTEIAKDRVPKESRVQHQLDRVRQAGIRGRELVNHMLQFSRETEQEKKPLPLSAIVKETTKLLRASIPTTVSISTEVRSESGYVLADPIQMQQVVMNLCTNAAYAMRGKGGILRVELSDFSVSPAEDNPDGIKPGLYMRLTASDTGSGIPPEIIDRVFDPFFTTKKPGEGTGLGLSVVHGIVTQHGGYVTVQSIMGKGSTFNVYLPKVAEEVPKEAGDQSDDVPTGLERVLFVDDEEALIEMGRDLLEELGYTVTVKNSSLEALFAVKENPAAFDLIITDQTMPEMTGVELAEEVLEFRADIPIILCTGFSHLVNADRAKQAGIKAFAMKPLTKAEIAKTIRSVLDR